MQIHKTAYKCGFVNAFDEYNEINRKLFGIPEIDELLSFEDKRNICIVNNSHSKFTADFLDSLILNVCINFHLTVNEGNNIDSNTIEKRKTIIIDAGNGNNLGHLYLKLVNKSLDFEFNLERILEEIIIIRAFTFYQMLHIIINEIPDYLLTLNNNYKIQIIVLDLMDTLLTSSHKFDTTDRDRHLSFSRDFKNNEKLVIEAVDLLLNLSKNHFTIMTYVDDNNIIRDQLLCKFNNCLEIDSSNSTDNLRSNKHQNMKTGERSQLLIKIKSKTIPAYARFIPLKIAM
ncbi:hypothetical protein [Candidatus Nitrosocosmicus sp. R]